MLSSKSGVRRFNSCCLKEVSTTYKAGDAVRFSDAWASVSCPTTIDTGVDISGLKNKNLVRSTERATKSAIRELAKLCGSTICRGCIYTDAKNELDVEEIRQSRLRDNMELFKARAKTAELELEALSVETTALVAEDTLGQFIQDTPPQNPAE